MGGFRIVRRYFAGRLKIIVFFEFMRIDLEKQNIPTHRAWLQRGCLSAAPSLAKIISDLIDDLRQTDMLIVDT